MATKLFKVKAIEQYFPVLLFVLRVSKMETLDN